LRREAKGSRDLLDRVATVKKLLTRQLEADLIGNRGKRKIDPLEPPLHTSHADRQRCSALLRRQAPVVCEGGSQ
jgi:hypothetical protein